MEESSVEDTDPMRHIVKKHKRPAPEDSPIPIDQQPQISAWADLLKDTANQQETIPGKIYTGEDEEDESLSYQTFSPGIINENAGSVPLGPGKVQVDVPEDEWKELWRPWRRALVVKLLGRSVSYRMLSQRLADMWASNHHLEIIDLEDGYYVVRFYAKEDYDYALENGPWVIQGHYLSVNKLSPGFLPSSALPSLTLVWVRVPRLPLEFFNDKFLMRVGDKLGKAVKVDGNTIMVSRGKYARVCVEIDLHQPLISTVIMNGTSLHVEYENLHQVCFLCGKYGHRQEDCDANPSHTSVCSPRNVSPPTPEQPVEPFGPWMLARSNRRKPVIPRPQTEVPPHASMQPGPKHTPAATTATVKASMAGSRFAPIADGTDHATTLVPNISTESGLQHLRDSGPPAIFQMSTKEQLMKTRERKGRGIQVKDQTKVKYQPRTAAHSGLKNKQQVKPKETSATQIHDQV